MIPTLAFLWLSGSILITAVFMMAVWRAGSVQDLRDVFEKMAGINWSKEKIEWAMVANVVLWPIIFFVYVGMILLSGRKEDNDSAGTD